MNIYGFNKTTLLDYPEHVAATVFTGGCNFRCPFCQNGGLVLCPGKQPLIPEEEVFAHLEKRQGILDGVCITGGEPTLSPDLEEFIRKVKSLGFAVKLDTNGYRPEVLEKLMGQGLLDYIAMDVKASREKYAFVAGFKGSDTVMTADTIADAVEGDVRGHLEFRDTFDITRIERSVELLKQGGIPYEFRTTVVKGIHRVEEFEEIGKWLAGCRAYFLQSYVESGEILAQIDDQDEDIQNQDIRNPNIRQEMTQELQEGQSKTSGAVEKNIFRGILGSFTAEELRQMAELAGKYIDRVELRGIQ